MNDTETTAIMRTQFNTHNMYGPKGQPIVAELHEDGIIFSDMARSISGFIDVAEGSIRDEHDLETIVRARYVNGYDYKSWDRRADKLRWE